MWVSEAEKVDRGRSTFGLWLILGGWGLNCFGCVDPVVGVIAGLASFLEPSASGKVIATPGGREVECSPFG